MKLCGVFFAQRDTCLGQHNGQRCAQLVRCIGQKLRLLVEQIAVASNMLIDGLYQWRDFMRHTTGIQRFERVPLALKHGLA